MPKRLRTRLNVQLSIKLRLIKQKFPDADYGGCGKIALVLGDMFKRLGYKVSYVLLAIDDFDKFEPILNNKLLPVYKQRDYLQNLEWRHVMVKVDGKLIDLSGSYNSIEEYVMSDESNEGMEIVGELSEKLLKHWVSCRWYWNHEFDWNKVKLIKKELKNIEKDLVK